ncbi:translocation protein [Aureobasidium melanogenum CBS 110374]|uniref:Translocation protein SEC62 n=1 Tax=Aureobasidium melanogenum (strain CBS 110374) TaxID=1043003 RepID=A0A074VW10_AURM1|nr:translocation protein [Aureobasidium melanogenum CBS 110374]KEQ63454.1 translocation protein [Aureobasidium melanogenum CBS 110374]
MPAGLQPGQQPTPEQIQAMQRQLAIEAQKNGMTVPQYVEQLKAQAMRQHMMQQQQMRQQQMQQQQMQQQQGQQQPITPGPPKPEAIAVANFLQSQDLKVRTCVFQEKRKDMFKVKRAIRALESPAYEKARAKNPLLPPVTDRASAENTFKLLPLSLLALRVSKIEQPPEQKKKRVKGLWTVKVEQQQEARDEFHYVWLYEGAQWKTKLYAVGALALILAIVFFPVWPYKLRIGVWYLSMGCLGLLGLFFAMAIFRLILFLVTMFTVPPGLWLYPNLFEDVGFFDSFRPVWGWQETAEDKKAKKEQKKAKREAKRLAKAGAPITQPAAEATSTSGAQVAEGQAKQRVMAASVEEADDE